MTREERNKFVEENMGLVHYWLRKYRDLPQYEDMFGYGILGLINALDNIKGAINTGYIKKYVIGYAVRGSNRYCNSMSKPSPGGGVYERVDCLSLDAQLTDTEEDSATFGELLVDNVDTYDEVMTACDFENLLYEKKIKNPDAYMLLTQGYDRKDVAEELGVSYECVRQQLGKFNKSDFV